ncbi:MAG TPA: hypothetical protein VJB57_10070, partial [Dehalococcoidia bacterium]|nr:hypothetical protein [Dehalococcoidia bacterium]
EGDLVRLGGRDGLPGTYPQLRVGRIVKVAGIRRSPRSRHLLYLVRALKGGWGDCWLTSDYLRPVEQARRLPRGWSRVVRRHQKIRPLLAEHGA